MVKEEWFKDLKILRESHGRNKSIKPAPLSQMKAQISSRINLEQLVWMITHNDLAILV